MKTAILVITGLEALMVLAGIVRVSITGIHSDHAGQGMTIAYIAIASVIVLLLAGPAALLAWNGKVLWLALALSIVALLPALVVLLIH